MSLSARRHMKTKKLAGTVIAADADIVSVIAGGAPGEVFILTAPESQPYRISQPLPLKSGQLVISQTGAVISGSRVLSDWQYESASGMWYTPTVLSRATDAAIESNMTGYAYKVAGEVDHARALNDVFRDGEQLQRYMMKANIRAGGFYQDAVTNRTYVIDDPTGHKVEISTTTEAVHAYSTVENCKLSGVTFEHFACLPQMSAVYCEGNGWEVDRCTFRLNHGMGLKFAYATSGRIHHSSFDRNGQMGLGLYACRNIICEDNSLTYNNVMGDYYALDWESGGVKFANCHDSIFRRNVSQRNCGVGVWVDIDNIGISITDNIVSDNESCGIRHEISFGAVIARNTVKGNGNGVMNGRWRTKDPSVAGQGDYFAPMGSGFMTAGINVNCSGGWLGDSMETIEVYGNTVTDNQNGIFLQQRNRGYSTMYPARARLVQAARVYDNTITMRGHAGDLWGWGVSGYGQYENPPVGTFADFYLSRGNVFHDNRYIVDSLSAIRFGCCDSLASGATYLKFSDYQTIGGYNFDGGSTCVVG